MKERNKKLITFLTSLCLLFGFGNANLQADQGCCYQSGSDWTCWMGIILATAAGAGTGYAAGHHHGNKGKEGPKGDTGPQGPGIPYDTETRLQVNFNSEFENTGNALQFVVTYNVPTGSVAGGEQFGVTLSPITSGTPSGELFAICAEQSKLFGDYYLVLKVRQDSSLGSPVAIGTFDFLVGVDPAVQFTLVSGKDPAVVQEWFAGDIVVLTAEFDEE